MASRALFTRNIVASMGPLCLLLLAMAGLSVVQAADSPAMEPPAGETDGGCYRPLSDVIWGFLVTLLSMTVSLWGSWKYRDGLLSKSMLTISMSTNAPLYDLGVIVEKSLRCVSLLWICHKMENPDADKTSLSWLKFLASSLLPCSKSLVRILASCDVVVYVSRTSPLLREEWLWITQTSNVVDILAGEVTDESEALVVGENGKRTDRNALYERRVLSHEGVGLLVWKEVFLQREDLKFLPKYDELKYLRANSGFAVIAIGVQAVGYIYAVAFRGVTNLRISPLEVIGLIFNIILLLKVCLCVTCNRCHRPLVIYMNLDWEREFEVVLNQIDKENFKPNMIKFAKFVITFVIFICLSSLLIHFVVSVKKVTNRKVVDPRENPIIVVLVGLCLEFFGELIMQISETLSALEVNVGMQYVGWGFINVALIVNEVGYFLATMTTISKWKTMQFDSRAEFFNLSQLIPFIG